MTTHRGVLIPAELADASVEQLDAYASKVRAGNGAVVRACHKLEDAAGRLGLTVEDLEDSVSIAGGRWLTPMPGLLDPHWRVSIYERLDGRFVISCRTPQQPDGTTRRTVLL